MRYYVFSASFVFCAICIIIVAGCRMPEIISPTGDKTINAGDSISFNAEYYPDAIYKWTFSGGAGDAYGQNPTVRFDRAGVYNITLTVLFSDFESGYSELKVTVNDPSPVSYVLSLDNYTVTRDTADSKTVVWVVEKDGAVVMRRNANNERQYTYFDNGSGNYRIWIERFYNGEYSLSSNYVEYSVP